MKDRTFSGKNSLSIIAFLQDWKVACNAGKIHETAAMWLFKHCFNGSVKSVVKAWINLPTKDAKAQEGILA